jgi:hypothetical protein
MAAEDWRGMSVVYLCPLKVLLNNLVPRLSQYTSWLGRTTAVWHGDITTPIRRTILRNRPDILLTTPESIEAMLVSVNVDHATSSPTCDWQRRRSRRDSPTCQALSPRSGCRPALSSPELDAPAATTESCTTQPRCSQKTIG